MKLRRGIARFGGPIGLQVAINGTAGWPADGWDKSGHLQFFWQNEFLEGTAWSEIDHLAWFAASNLHIYIGTGEAARQQAIGINRLIAWKKHEKASSGSSNLSKYLRLWLKSGGALSYHQNEPLVEVVVDGRRLQSRYIGVSLNFQLLAFVAKSAGVLFWIDTDLAINCLSPSSHQLHSTALCTTAIPESYNNARQFVLRSFADVFNVNPRLINPDI